MLITLKRRAEFQRVRGGGRWATPAFVLEGKARLDGDGSKLPAGMEMSDTSPRVGFTITKQIGNAVVRNRIRRRLKAAVSHLVALHARPGFDYVIIARDAVIERPFAELERELGEAFRRVHTRRASEQRQAGGPRRDK